MRFFGRRGRSRSVDRSAKNRQQRPLYEHASAGHTGRSDSRARSNMDNDSVGSELPTLDQFEIAVPSKSFNNSSVGDHEYSAEARDEDAMDNRSTTDISSITSVSYRAGYYYLRNIKKKPAERKLKQTGCLPSCQPCSCSWFTCCCCAEAKNELAATAAVANNTHIILGHPPLSSRDKNTRKMDRPGRRGLVHHGQLPNATYRQQQQKQHAPDKNNYNGHPRLGSAGPVRYSMTGGDQRAMPTVADDGKGEAFPAIKSNHSLFDELSEEEEMYAAQQRGRQKQQQQLKQRKISSKNMNIWLPRGRAAGAALGYGAEPRDYATREKSSRNRSRGRGYMS
jgi:hypothetical protein